MRYTTLTMLAALVLGAAASWAPAADSPAGLRLTAQSAITLATPQKENGIRLALDDLAADFEAVLGCKAAAADGTAGTVVVRIDPAVTGVEQYRVEITPAGVRITGSDRLGAIYGIYRFSHECLGVDPYWFWKGIGKPKQAEIVLAPRTLESRPYTFRYRGWFVNDEDLLTEWKDGGGARYIDYPFYHQVVAPAVIDRVFEAALRAEANMVIPASFVDVMNPPEAALVARAAARGLYVTQHHIEALGVSHQGFEVYWKNKGRPAAFSYSTDAARVRETWTAYAKKWHELAGDQVVWQLGLRGKGDRPVWTADKGVTEASAGKFISQAMKDQLAIVKEVDGRPHPPLTTTLWAEGSQLMSRGALEIPEGVAVIFADEGRSQMMQPDFRDTPRQPGRKYGVYYHVGFWVNGPHMVQGTRPEKVKRNFDAIVAKGDTHYALINVCNVREHLVGIEAAMGLMRSHKDWTEEKFWAAWAPPAIAKQYQELLASLIDIGDGRLLQDGTAYSIISWTLLPRVASGKKEPAIGALSKEVIATGGKSGALAESIARLDRVIAEFNPEAVPPPMREFTTVNLLVQARMLRGIYDCMRQLILAAEDPARLADAEAAMEKFLKDRDRAAQGDWAGWYRGDKKENWPEVLKKIQDQRKKAGK